MSFRSKYLKYKYKYLNLIGGTPPYQLKLGKNQDSFININKELYTWLDRQLILIKKSNDGSIGRRFINTSDIENTSIYISKLEKDISPSREETISFLICMSVILQMDTNKIRNCPLEENTEIMFDNGDIYYGDIKYLLNINDLKMYYNMFKLQFPIIISLGKNVNSHIDFKKLNIDDQLKNMKNSKDGEIGRFTIHAEYLIHANNYLNKQTEFSINDNIPTDVETRSFLICISAILQKDNLNTENAQIIFGNENICGVEKEKKIEVNIEKLMKYYNIFKSEIKKLQQSVKKFELQQKLKNKLQQPLTKLFNNLQLGEKLDSTINFNSNIDFQLERMEKSNNGMTGRFQIDQNNLKLVEQYIIKIKANEIPTYNETKGFLLCISAILQEEEESIDGICNGTLKENENIACEHNNIFSHNGTQIAYNINELKEYYEMFKLQQSPTKLPNNLQLGQNEDSIINLNSNIDIQLKRMETSDDDKIGRYKIDAKKLKVAKQYISKIKAKEIPTDEDIKCFLICVSAIFFFLPKRNVSMFDILGENEYVKKKNGWQDDEKKVYFYSTFSFSGILEENEKIGIENNCVYGYQDDEKVHHINFHELNKYYEMLKLQQLQPTTTTKLQSNL